MSELINNNQRRKELLKHMILQLHEGKSAEVIKKQLIRLLGKIPYGVVVEAEQELISEGLPAQEVLKLCDVHGQAMKGVVDLSGAVEAPPGHPVHTFRQENRALEVELKKIDATLAETKTMEPAADARQQWLALQGAFNLLSDVDKHYRRKENLLFPYLEKYEITGPPTVMWGKDDEIRESLKGAQETLRAADTVSAEELLAVAELSLTPAVNGLEEMIYKEEEILFPMCLDTLTEIEWYEIYRQSDEIGFCLYDPQDKWEPSGVELKKEEAPAGMIKLPTGTFNLAQLTALFNTLPVDITFVDAEDTVRFFSNSPERIFDRNRAILGRKVQMCHPPSSVNVVQQILDDFRSGREDRAAFWINLHGKFIHIEYFALRNENGDYLGTMEVSQNLTGVRKLEGEQRLLSYRGTEANNDK